jgi:hypothetical protein
MPLVGDRRGCHAGSGMEVTLYSRPGCELSQRIRELLRDRGVEFDELEGEEAVAVIDGVAIPGARRAQIEQAIGWVGC